MKVKLERVTGVVAMSYLVLIPVGALYMYKRVEKMDAHLTIAWQKLGLPQEEADEIRRFRLGDFFR